MGLFRRGSIYGKQNKREKMLKKAFLPSKKVKPLKKSTAFGTRVSPFVSRIVFSGKIKGKRKLRTRQRRGRQRVVFRRPRKRQLMLGESPLEFDF